MKGGFRFLINRAHIILITGMMDDSWIGIIKLLKIYFSRLLTKEDFRRAVKERWTAERSVEFEERMRMLIPAQFPKVWGETRIANKIGMVGDLAGLIGSTLEEMRDICLCISGECLNLDWIGLAN